MYGCQTRFAACGEFHKIRQCKSSPACSISLCQKKSFQWKRKFGYQADIVKILLKLCELLGDIIGVWDVLKA